MHVDRQVIIIGEEEVVCACEGVDRGEKLGCFRC